MGQPVINTCKKTKHYKGKEYKYYEASCTLKTDEESHRITASGKTRKIAQDNLFKKIDTKDENKYTSVPVPENHLKDALYAFIDYKKREGWRDSTYIRNRTIIKNQIEPYDIAKIPPLKVKHDDILSLKEEIKKKYGEKGHSTEKKVYALLSAYFNFVYKDNRFNNPCYAVTISYTPQLRKENVLDSDEIKRMLKACDTLGGNADILQFDFFTYERPGEVSVLKFSDWDEKTSSLKINRTYTQDASGHVRVSNEGDTKTKTSARTIMISERANDILKKRWAAQKKKSRTSYIWTQESDETKPIAYSTLRRLLIKVLKEAGIEKHITPHGLRHSAITYYCSKDKNQLMAISQNAGHSRPSITEDIYMHTLAEHQIAAKKSADKYNEQLKDEQ